MVSKPLTIAIDGPAASGKSTIGKLLAERLEYRYFDTGTAYRTRRGQERFYAARRRFLYFDTGAMYRAVTWVALQRGVDLADEAAVTALAEEIEIDVTHPTDADGRQYTVFAGDEDVTWAIRRPEVDANVSVVAAYPGVRAALTEQQRRIGRRGAVVMVGRDIGTVVMPDADVKIYLDASVEERARRRDREVAARGGPADYERILRDMGRRDRIDSERDAAPLRPAEDAVIINTDGLTVQQVLDVVLRLVKEKDAEGLSNASTVRA